MFRYIVFLIATVTVCLGQITSIENADGSYSIGLTSTGLGNTGDAVVALISQAAGWTPTSLKQSSTMKSGTSYNSAQQQSSNAQELMRAWSRPTQETVQKFLLMLKDNPDMINLLSKFFGLIGDYFSYLYNTSDFSVDRWYLERFGH